MKAVQSIADLRRLAQRRLPRAVFDFIEGGAEDELTLSLNRKQFERLGLVQRFPVDVSRRDLGVTLFGRRLAAPLAIAPMGMTGLARANADLLMARAARDLGIPFTLSMAGTASLEEISGVEGLDRWFQLYPIRDRDFAMSLADRATASGFSTLVVTVDCPVGSKRERDRRNGLTLPIRATPRNVLDLVRRPGWLADMARHGPPRLKNLPEGTFGDTAREAAYMARQINPAADWSYIAQLRRRWPGAFIIKGLMAGADAQAAVESGADAVIVSNHGGRQLDGALPPLAALPAVVAAVGGRIPVLCDSGFRRGSDIVKALALGASAVMIGRACLWGAAAGGAPGALRALEVLLDEVDRTMAFLGATSLEDLGPDCLQPFPTT